MLRNARCGFRLMEGVSKYLLTGATKPRVHSLRSCYNGEAVVSGGVETRKITPDVEPGGNSQDRLILEAIPANGQPIQWKEVIQAVATAGSKDLTFDNVCFAILYTLRRQNMFDEARSLMHYLFSEKKCSPALFYLFLSFTTANPDILSGFEKIIFRALKQLKTFRSIRIYIPFLLANPKLWKDVVDFYMSHCGDRGDHALIINYALKNDDLDVFNHFIQLHNNSKCSIIAVYILHFIETKLNENSEVDVLSLFKKFSYLLTMEAIHNVHYIVEKSSQIFEKLNNNSNADKDFVWIAKMNEASKFCGECLQRIKTLSVTDADIENLKVELENYVKDEEFLNSISNPREWEEFESFLKSVDYNIVIDYLNMKFFFIKPHQHVLGIMKTLKDVNLKPLILGRRHVKDTATMKQLKKLEFPVFLVDNLSKDDVFVLYAALSKGKHCLIASNDQMSFMKHGILSEKGVKTCESWLRFHRCGITLKGIMFPSRLMYGIQETTQLDEGEFQYHFIGPGKRLPRIGCISRLTRKRMKLIERAKEANTWQKSPWKNDEERGGDYLEFDPWSSSGESRMK